MSGHITTIMNYIIGMKNTYGMLVYSKEHLSNLVLSHAFSD
jgi:hypothetical protein